MFELVDGYSQNNAVIKVIGIGGGGGNALEHMLTTSMEGVDFICANTDSQALKNSAAPTVLQLGNSVTKGLGAGANPEVGRQAALEDRDRIVEIFLGCTHAHGDGEALHHLVGAFTDDMTADDFLVITNRDQLHR